MTPIRVRGVAVRYHVESMPNHLPATPTVFLRPNQPRYVAGLPLVLDHDDTRRVATMSDGSLQLYQSWAGCGFTGTLADNADGRFLASRLVHGALPVSIRFSRGHSQIEEAIGFRWIISCGLLHISALTHQEPGCPGTWIALDSPAARERFNREADTAKRRILDHFATGLYSPFSVFYDDEDAARSAAATSCGIDRP